MRCFFDADEQIEVWGKYLAEELSAIYREQAAAVVVFVSAEYAARDWIRHKRRTALVRAVRERWEYVPRDANAAGHGVRDRVATAAPRGGFGLRPAG